MCKEDITLAYRWFRHLNPHNELFNSLLDNVERVAPRPLIDLRAIQVGSDDAERAVVDELLRPRGRDPRIIQLMKEITARFMEHMKRKLQFVVTPHHTQILTLMTFHEFYVRRMHPGASASQTVRDLNTLVAEVSTGEGKSIIIAMLAVYFVKYHGKKVHILANNETLMVRDFESNREFFDLFEVPTGDDGSTRPLKSASCKAKIDGDSDICYCLNTAIMTYYRASVTKGTDGLEEVILIVDEVDDLVIDENPRTNWVEPDVEQSEHILACFDALRTQGDRARKPSGCADSIWQKARGARTRAKRMTQGKDYARYGGQYKLLGRQQRILKNSVSPALDYLNYSEGLVDSVYMRSNSMVTCTPYVFNQYECIFGLTGSVGGPAEKAYLEQTYRAHVFTAPKFLDTCSDTEQKIMRKDDVRAYSNEDQQHAAIVRLACEKCSATPVIIITKSIEEVDVVHNKLERAMGSTRLQKLVARDAAGNDLTSTSAQIIQNSTRPVNEDAPEDGPREWRITVTDYYGGRGIDYRLKDDQANAAGGIMLIISHIPETKREWIQWVGRTGRQDRNGQYSVLLNRREQFLSTVSEVFDRGPQQSDPHGCITTLLEKRNETAKVKLSEYETTLAEASRLNELCEAVYRQAGGRASDSWPGSHSERELRDFIAAGNNSERDVESLKAKLGILPRDWEMFVGDQWQPFSVDEQGQMNESYHRRPAPRLVFDLDSGWQINLEEMTASRQVPLQVNNIRGRCNGKRLPKLAEPDLEPEPEPDPGEQCIICFENFTSGGIACASSHHVCDECFIPYIHVRRLIQSLSVY
eukprot:COSAG01_NODE_9069_length_2564_cov_4.288021_1_plen_811_part_10